MGDNSGIVGIDVVDGAMDGAMDGEADDSVDFLFCVGWVVTDGEREGI